jgi:hypothetical protein
MAQYRLLAKHFINNSVQEEGAIVEFDGKPGIYMELVEEEKPKPAKGNGKKGAGAPNSEDTAGE